MNPHKGDVPFQANGRQFTLRYNHKALVRLEAKLDKGLMQLMEEVGDPKRMRLGTVVDMLWAGLQQHHPGTTPDDAAELLDDLDDGAAGALAIIDEAFRRAFNTGAGTKGTNPQRREANGTGTPSSSNTSPSATTPTHSGN